MQGIRCLVTASAAVVLLLAPAAHAHGTAQPRAIDTRILADDDGALEYGTPTQADTGAMDLLALDVREARNATGQPYLIFRVSMQAETDTLEGRTVAITFKADGRERSFDFHGNGLSFNSSTFDRLDPPQDIGDGYPKAIDGWVSYKTLDARPGTSLTEIRVQSGFNDQKGDVMPGTWYTAQTQDQPVPHLPSMEPGQVPDPDEGQETIETPEPGAYVLVGPATLLGAAPIPTPLDLNTEPASFTLTLSNPLSETDQFVTISTTGVTNASVDPNQANIKAGASKDISIRVNPDRNGTLNVAIASDLGGYLSFSVPVTAKVAAPMNTTAPTASTEPKKSPGAPIIGTALVLALAGLTRLRREVGP